MIQFAAFKKHIGLYPGHEAVEAFADVEQYLGKCRFSDCRHRTEPGCAIKAAIANGELSPERWKSYIGLKNEAKYSDNKAAFLRQKQQRNKNIAKFNRKKKEVL